jgi:hypothetical protein
VALALGVEFRLDGHRAERRGRGDATGLATPSRMGWLQAPDRQAVFVCCGSCSNCSDAELETNIVARISDSRPETGDGSATAAEPAPPPIATAAAAPLAAAATTADIYSPPMAEAGMAPVREAAWASRAARSWTEPLMSQAQTQTQARLPEQELGRRRTN